MIVAYRNGAPVRLGDIGRVIDGVQNDKVAAWYNGTRGVVLAIQRQPGTNTIEVVDARQATCCRRSRRSCRRRSSSDVLYDRSQSIRESVDDVKFTLLLALGAGRRA